MTEKKREEEESPIHEVEVVPPEGGEPGPVSGLVLARASYPLRLPLIPLDERPIFPGMRVPMLFDDPGIKHVLMEAAQAESSFVGLVLRRHGEESTSALHEVGVLVEVLQIGQLGTSGPIQVMFGALERFRIQRILRSEPAYTADVEYLVDVESTLDDETKAYMLAIIKAIKDLIKLEPLHKEELTLFMAQTSLREPGKLADFAAALTSSDGEVLQEVLEAVHLHDRLKKVLFLLKKEIDISRLQAKISKQVEEKLTRQQREFFLREQLKAIKRELGLEKEDKETEVERFLARMEQLELSEEARDRIGEELDKLRLLDPSSPEFNVTRNYLDWLTGMPWGLFTEDNFDLERAAKVLDRDHYGLEDVKERILEFLAVGILKGEIAGSILCFVGPPGVGKTSIGHSIAESVGREFYRLSLGGIRDEAEIKGHRRTYIGALPGKFVQAIKTCGTSNPVVMLDEIDKIGASYQGDPASALLEVLDPAQNHEFLDHYLDVRFDLSNVLFICTANQLDTIPRPLLDRMEVISLAGYILEEKLEIARRYLVPKALESHGLRRGQMSFTRSALREIIDGYAREPGVRGLEHRIQRIMRKGVGRIVRGEIEKVQVDKAEVGKILGRRLFADQDRRGRRVPGVVTGLAWTSMGGTTLDVEANAVTTGRCRFKQTGQLGSVMVESAEIAYSYVRALLDDDPKIKKFFEESTIHLHVPAGATPKDGPSAGITMAAALYSLAKGRPVRPGLAMTGELTLTGKVMPIGGVKEKTIGAKRAKIRRLVFPEQNRRDFEELPEGVRKGLTVHFVESFPEVIEICFPSRRGRPGGTRKAGG